jgi:hypothetical protein
MSGGVELDKIIGESADKICRKAILPGEKFRVYGLMLRF